jgi:curli biogenesis system outer membrane secretion channel CsgG
MRPAMSVLVQKWHAGGLGLVAAFLGAAILPAFAQAPAAAPKQAPAATTPAKPAAASKVAPVKGVVKTAVKPIDQILKMVRLKMPEATIVQQIHQYGTALRAQPDDLIALKEAGASDGILLALSGSGTPAAKPGTGTVPARPPATPLPSAPAVWNTDLSTVACDPSPEASKRVLAVDEFDYGSVKSAVAAVFGTQVDVGKGIQALFVKRLAESKKYRIVERKNLQKVLAEQDFGASNRTKQGTQSRIGRIIGADAYLMGTIVVFGRDDRKKQVGAGGWVPKVPLVGGAKVKWGEDKAVVAISFRLVDAETSEIIAQGEARGESTRKSKGFAIGAFGSGGGGAGGYDMTSSNFAETIIGEATIDCVNKLAEQSIQQEPQIKRRQIELETRVADISGNKVYLAAGANEGVLRCDRFDVFRILKEITDPVTKEVIDYDVQKVGELVATEVRDRVTIGLYEGTAPPEVRFLARKVAKP